jgi:hypothetical protein
MSKTAPKLHCGYFDISRRNILRASHADLLSTRIARPVGKFSGFCDRPHEFFAAQ